VSDRLDLTDVPTPVLQRALDLILSGGLVTPLSAFDLNGQGLDALAKVDLSQLNASGLRALLSALVAERRQRGPATPELVWTGPEAKVSGARDTAIVLRELFTGAKQSVLVAGFRFDHGKTLLQPLHAAMRDRGVTCSVFADRSEAEAFIGREWPFGPPLPVVHFDARGAKYSSVHAKCVVVDTERVFVTSANFTDRGQRRNVEVGLLVTDRALAQRVEQQWFSLVTSGEFTRV